MFNLGPLELLVIVVVALVVLGPQRLPDAMRQVGKAVAEARRWSSSLTTTVQSAFDEPDRPEPAPVTAPAPATVPTVAPGPADAPATARSGAPA